MIDAIEQFLNRTYHQVADDRVLATVMSARVEVADPTLAAAGTFEAHVRREIEWFRGRAFSATPDGYTAAFDGPARAIRCAGSIAAGAPRFGRRIRAGLHTGECQANGQRFMGPAVDAAQALSATATHGEVLVSRTVKDLVAGSGLAFVDRGMHPFDDEAQRWRIFAARLPGA
jgi:class 3 adenylate cyclase